MTHVDAFRISVNPLPRPARLDGLARPTMRKRCSLPSCRLAGFSQAAGSIDALEGPLQSILESIQGPVARIVAVIIIIATGLALAFGDTSGGFRKLIRSCLYPIIACGFSFLPVVLQLLGRGPIV